MTVQIREATLNDVTTIRRMHATSWLATYPSEQHNVPYEWVKAETDKWLTPEALEGSKRHFSGVFNSSDHFYRVAVDDGEIVGFVHGLINENTKTLGGFYVLPDYHGTGLAQRLMDQVNEWFGNDLVELEVVAYNERAIRFYEKNGFKKQPGTDGIFKDMIPDFKMRRGAK